MTLTRTREDVGLIAHLMRRAGFGATPDELDAAVEVGYDATLDPVDDYELPTDLIRRYFVDQSDLRNQQACAAIWMYQLALTRTPLRKKTLFGCRGEQVQLPVDRAEYNALPG